MFITVRVRDREERDLWHMTARAHGHRTLSGFVRAQLEAAAGRRRRKRDAQGGSASPSSTTDVQPTPDTTEG